MRDLAQQRVAQALFLCSEGRVAGLSPQLVAFHGDRYLIGECREEMPLFRRQEASTILKMHDQNTDDTQSPTERQIHRVGCRQGICSKSGRLVLREYPICNR